MLFFFLKNICHIFHKYFLKIIYQSVTINSRNFQLLNIIIDILWLTPKTRSNFIDNFTIIIFLSSTILLWLPNGIHHLTKVRQLTTKGTSLTTKGSHLTEKGTSFPTKGSHLTEKGTSFPAKGSHLTAKGTPLTTKGSR